MKIELATICNELKNITFALTKMERGFEKLETSNKERDSKVTILETNYKTLHKNLEDAWDHMRNLRKDVSDDTFNRVKLWLYGLAILALAGNGANILNLIK